MVRRYVPAFASSLVVHALVAAVVLWLMSPPVAVPDVKAARTMVAFVVPPEDSTFPGLNPVDRSQAEWRFPEGKSASLRIGGLRIDVAKIGGRARVLFPFLTPGLSLDHFLIVPQRDRRSLLQNPFMPARTAVKRKPVRPLLLSDRALQSLVDKSWARRERWTAFEPLARLAEAHDPDAGRLPALLQQYGAQNSLQPYTDVATRDPRFWAQLGLAADHVSFIGFIRRYASGHPSTRATTELLFLLDTVAEANRDALNVLLDTDPAKDLRWTRDANPDAYRLAAELRRYYKSELDRRGLTSEEAITAHYDRLRLAILDGIVRTTPNGYRANDARFLMGAIYWRQQNTDDALRSWSEITPDGNDSHGVANALIVAALRGRGIARPRTNTDPHGRTASGQPLDSPLRVEIDRILKNEHGRWVDLSYDRLRRFGFRFDTY
jgi:hypothetical protein